MKTASVRRLAAHLIAPSLLLGLALAAEDKPAEKDLKDIDPKEVGVEPVQPKKDAKTGFVVGGKNATEVIRKLTELNGRSIARLEADMRPGALSTKGFLGADEKLADVMAKDNDYVLGELGLTHQDLARHMHMATGIALKRTAEANKAGKPIDHAEFTYHGRKLRVRIRFSKGFQESPFDDGTKTSMDGTVENLSNGKSLSYSLLVPHMIERYGFYEGQGTPYRVEPRKIVEVFDFLTAKKK